MYRETIDTFLGVFKHELIYTGAFAVGALAMVYGSKKCLKAWKDSVDPDARKKRILRAEMEAAPTYEEWALAATRLDQLEGHGEQEQATRWQREIRLYDRQLLKDRVRDLRRVRQNGKLQEMLFAVRADLLRNLGNMTNRFAHMAVQKP
jgi:Domain of unknown function (DUF3336)